MSDNKETPEAKPMFELKDVAGASGVTRKVLGTKSTPVERNSKDI